MPTEPPPVELTAKNLSMLAEVASQAPGGDWRTARGGEVLSDAQPFTRDYAGQLIAESCMPATAVYLAAFQPRVALALLERIVELEQKIRSLVAHCDHTSWFDGPCVCSLEFGHEGAHRMVPA